MTRFKSKQKKSSAGATPRSNVSLRQTPPPTSQPNRFAPLVEDASVDAEFTYAKKELIVEDDLSDHTANGNVTQSELPRTHVTQSPTTASSPTNTASNKSSTETSPTNATFQSSTRDSYLFLPTGAKPC